MACCTVYRISRIIIIHKKLIFIMFVATFWTGPLYYIIFCFNIPSDGEIDTMITKRIRETNFIR